MSETAEITVTKKGVSIPWAIAMALFTLAGGGGAGTIAAQSQTSSKMEAQDKAIGELKIETAVIKEQTKGTQEDVADLKKQVEKIDTKLDKVLDEVRK